MRTLDSVIDILNLCLRPHTANVAMRTPDANHFKVAVAVQGHSSFEELFANGSTLADVVKQIETRLNTIGLQIPEKRPAALNLAEVVIG